MGIWTRDQPNEGQLILVDSSNMMMLDQVTVAITEVANTEGHYYGKMPVIIGRSIQDAHDDDALSVTLALGGETLLMLLGALNANLPEFAEEGWIPKPPDGWPGHV